MYQQWINPVDLYLPLLASPYPQVRQQACLILLGTFGDRALTYLRRLSEAADPQVRQDARLAQLALVEATGRELKIQRFRGMYVECMGQLRVYISNKEMRDSDWTQAEGGRAGRRKVQAALAYLIHCGRRGSNREELGAAIWEGKFSASSLSRTLSTLRQALDRYANGTFALERALVIEDDYCMLDPDCYHTDVMFFEQAFALATRIEQEQGLDAAAPAYTNTLQLYFGPYMAEVSGSAKWSRSRRDYLMNSFVIAVERLAEHAYSRGLYGQCIEVCSLALDADPAADEIAAWRLRAYAAAMRYAELEHAYRSYLRAARLDVLSDAAQQDMVVQLYQSLRRAPAR